MEEPLRVLVRVDTRDATASVEVRGSLTGSNCETLLRILRHTATLGASICVNLTRAVRVESDAFTVLAAAVREIDGPVEITRRPGGPEDGPAPGGTDSLDSRPQEPNPQDSNPQDSRALQRDPLDNARALEMILARDRSVLAAPRVQPGPGLPRPAGRAAGHSPGS